MKRSDTIGKLAEALAAAQGEMRNALKDSANPFFKSKYADLASIIDACRQPLSKHGLAYCQFTIAREEGAGVETILCHSSGEWVSEELILPVAKDDAQGVGSAISYARRYSLAAIIGMASEDDDGNAAAAAPARNGAAKSSMSKQMALSILEGAASKGSAALEKAWAELPLEIRKQCKPELDSTYKAKAAEADHALSPA